jgi:transposase
LFKTNKKTDNKRRLAMTNEHKHLDFTGQDIYIGIDVHLRSWSVSIYTKDFEHKTYTQPPDTRVLVNYLRKNFPGGNYKSAYEAGFSGYWLHDELKINGIESMVVNPSDVPLKDKDKKNKTDRIDSRRLAKSIRSNMVEGIYIPTEQQREDRTLLRTRQAMVRKQTRVKNQIKSFLYFYGIIITEEDVGKHWSRNYVQWLDNITLREESGTFALKVYLEELKHLKGLIAQTTRQIRQLAANQRYSKLVKLLISIPGISTLSAMTLLTEIHEIGRFNKFDRLNSYVGLKPSEHSSGEKINRSDITQRKNPYLRHILVESSWIAIKKDPALLMAYHKFVSKGKTRSRAIIKIARKLLNRIYYVLKSEQPYCLGIVE